MVRFDYPSQGPYFRHAPPPPPHQKKEKNWACHRVLALNPKHCNSKHPYAKSLKPKALNKHCNLTSKELGRHRHKDQGMLNASPAHAWAFRLGRAFGEYKSIARSESWHGISR